jgi:MSHA pilin protein MshD
MCSRAPRPQAGMSLIEVVVFIVVLGLALAGVMILYSQATRASADPLVRKQTLAIASSLLEEIELRPFTYCDPDEPAVYTATAAVAAQCGGDAAHVEGMGPETFSPPGTEDRYDQTKPFDNVNDYHGFSMAGANIRGADGSFVTGLDNYSVAVTVANAGGDFGFADATAVLLITVTSTHAGTGTTVSLQGYRFRYAPNSP